jgi:regulatory protein
MKIEKVSKNKVYLEGSLVFDINFDIKNIYGLEEGLDLPFELYKKMLYDSCLLKGYKLISRKEYSRKELFNKLFFIYKDKAIVDSVLNSFEEKSYINDYEYASLYIRNKKFGKQRIKYELSMRGIDEKIIDKIYSESNPDEKSEIKGMLKKVEGKEYRKKVEFFLRKGYNLDDILQIIKD